MLNKKIIMGLCEIVCLIRDMPQKNNTTQTKINTRMKTCHKYLIKKKNMMVAVLTIGRTY